MPPKAAKAPPPKEPKKGKAADAQATSAVAAEPPPPRPACSTLPHVLIPHRFQQIKDRPASTAFKCVGCGLRSIEAEKSLCVLLCKNCDCAAQCIACAMDRSVAGFVGAFDAVVARHGSVAAALSAYVPGGTVICQRSGQAFVLLGVAPHAHAASCEKEWATAIYLARTSGSTGGWITIAPTVDFVSRFRPQEDVAPVARRNGGGRSSTTPEGTPVATHGAVGAATAARDGMSEDADGKKKRGRGGRGAGSTSERGGGSRSRGGGRGRTGGRGGAPSTSPSPQISRQASTASVGMEERTPSGAEIFAPTEVFSVEDIVKAARQADPCLRPAQVACLEHVEQKAVEKSASLLAKVASKWKMAGVNRPSNMTDEVLLERMEAYILREAPKIAWFPAFKTFNNELLVETMSKDTMFRNLHEVRHGSGNTCTNARTGWEVSLFGEGSRKLTPVERPKYGLVNVYNDPNGPRTSGDQYGTVYFVFRGQAVDHRFTMTACDSGGGNAFVASSAKGITELLGDFSPEEFSSLIELVIGHRASTNTDSSRYKELQLHGDVYLQHEHIAAVCMLSHKHRNQSDVQKLLRLADKIGVPLVGSDLLSFAAKHRLCPVEELRQLRMQAEADLQKAKEETRAGGGNYVTDVDEPFHCLAGPQHMAARREFDKWCHALVALDMIRLRQLAATGAKDPVAGRVGSFHHHTLADRLKRDLPTDSVKADSLRARAEDLIDTVVPRAPPIAALRKHVPPPESRRSKIARYLMWAVIAGLVIAHVFPIVVHSCHRRFLGYDGGLRGLATACYTVFRSRWNSTDASAVCPRHDTVMFE